MRIYLDVCCLNRPFDDQSQERVRLEGEAVKLVFDLMAKGHHQWASSEAVEYEISRHPNERQRANLEVLLETAPDRLVLDQETVALAEWLESEGVPAMDAIHLALAERHGCDILLTTDDTLIRRVRRLARPLRTRVENPARWIAEVLEL